MSLFFGTQQLSMSAICFRWRPVGEQATELVRCQLPGRSTICGHDVHGERPGAVADEDDRMSIG